ncbi:hypothetical protein JOF46_001222 [Paeniglutamicibacter psychrophenolicus]|uniref:Uncharacterized protein n=1 Tax=Paeniglutamicibacter psychrophenolicus TaxID=257454 RepID=A0ABS4WAS7_9MICC|nr:hypothetical protein [Paeniglutamicibacter psychrophenolicus]
MAKNRIGVKWTSAAPVSGRVVRSQPLQAKNASTT